MTSWLEAQATWLETTRLHGIVQTVEWVVPATQTVHILAIAAVFGSSLVLAMRALGLAGTDWSAAQWNARLGGWINIGLIVLLVSGAVLIAGEPGRSLLNFTFQLKMLLLIGALVLLVPLRRGMAKLTDAGVRVTPSVKLLAALLFILWLAIITCGRWIAYS